VRWRQGWPPLEKRAGTCVAYPGWSPLSDGARPPL